MKTIVLLTCVGSQVSPSIIETIKGHPKYDIKIIGVDNKKKEEAVGAYFVDEFRQVPLGSHPKYVDAILSIIREFNVEVILPGSDEEARALSANKDRLREIGCTVACSDRVTMERSINKFETMQHLMINHIPIAECYEINSIDDLLENAKKLGYPSKPFVIKPKVGRGGRGFRVVKEQVDVYQAFMNGNDTFISGKQLVEIFTDHEDKVKNFFIMEYLPGKKYSIDMLIRNGEIRSYVIRNKIFPVGSPTQLADIVFDDDIFEYALSIIKILKFDYFVQIEIGRNDKAAPRLIEINPRLDATLPICMGIGINFYHEIINHALGQPYSEHVRIINMRNSGIRFFRYWQHLFISEKFNK